MTIRKNKPQTQRIRRWQRSLDTVCTFSQEASMLMESTITKSVLITAFICVFACSSGNDGEDGDGQSTDFDSAIVSDTGSSANGDTASVDEDTSSANAGTDVASTDSPDGTDDTATETVEIDTTGCGNGVIEKPEVCDDGNSASGDGCSALCDAVEYGYVCSEAGQPCIYTIECGDGHISGNETCDDHNTVDSDGCSADCQQEAGWICPSNGENCEAAACGDSIVAGKEECDDGNETAEDGCSDTCRLEDGWACDTPGTPCHETVCGDGVKEGNEFCDDGNTEIWDGCGANCEKEPDCSKGACVSTCGDGFILPGDNEECDDGNLQNNDGCSATCQKEDGFVCDKVEDTLPEVLEVSIKYRDFIGIPAGDAKKHPDFQAYSGSDVTYGMVESVLGEDGKPVYTGICEAGREVAPPPPDTDDVDDTATDDTDNSVDTDDAGDSEYIPDEVRCPYDDQSTSKEAYDQWYNDNADANITVVSTLSLAQQEDATTYYYENDNFFPLDDAGWVAEGLERASDGVDGELHNFSFTSELRYWFKYEGNESLKFTGDDDVWVFINNQLAVDIGGLHPTQTREIVL
ncbi:MAG: DUF4215 domain-containing protein, partial [Deltaproteobacteria bacterium]|nr:DUF4215 domain-containing protein [Deltaproteobacteria bacterium]